MPPRARREFISHVEFGVFSPEEVKRFAVVNVTEPATYSSSLPVANGTADHRMGSVDRRLACGTCKHGVNQCPGHAGMIGLNYPVVHPSFLEVILKLLKTVCFFCSEVLLTEAQIAAVRRLGSRKQKLAEAVAYAKNCKACPACSLPTPVYSRQGQTIKCDFAKAVFSDLEEKQYCERPFTAAEVRMILTMIRDENCVLLGLNPKVSRPENFVLTVMVVPPPIVRPSVVMSEGSKARGQDDLTAKICDIIKANAVVHTVLEKEACTIPRVGLSLTAQQAVADLAFHVTTFINNDLRGQRQSVQRSGLPTRSIISRLKGKEGRIRGYLMGKRVDFSARSVISPDSQMDVDQVGVPAVVAERLTVPIFVMESNLEAVRLLVRSAASDARTIRREGGALVMLEYAEREKEASALLPGDVVERALRNDDIVLFNRQPSLHKGSMMGYRVLICKGSRTFRLNLACTGVSNADYDGDEMNVHVPQDPQAQAEARHLMCVPAHIITAQSNKPSIGLVQDVLIGAWLLTGDDVRVSRTRLATLHLCLHYPLRPLPPGLEFTGREAFSLLLPPHLTYSRGPVRIAAGHLVAGRLCRQTLGTASGSLVHHLWLFEGAEVAKRFLSDAQRLVNRWLQWRGFSIRLSDCEPDARTTERLRTLVATAEAKARAIASNEQLRLGTPHEVLEDAISTICNKVLTDAGKLVHASLDERTNALYQDITSGAKGNLVNITQLSGLVGQQCVEGQRVDASAPLDDFARKGFVRRSYFEGLQSYEFFAHTMAGREGLIDTSVKTATTGYLQRKLIKAKETARVCYDLTVRNTRNNILQFEYGGDGYDATYLVRQNLDMLRLSRADFLARLQAAEAGPALAVWQQLLRVRTQGLRRELDVAAYVPVPFEAVLVKRELQPEPAVGPAELRARVDALCAAVCTLRHGWRSNLELLLRWHLRHENVGRFTEAALARTLQEIHHLCVRANVAPGEAVGPLASTSIGEPLTQLTLNSVAYDTELLLRVAGRYVKVPIGAFVEAHLAAAGPACERHPNDTWLAWIPAARAEILSGDADGRVAWRAVEAVTKHPVVNADGSATLLRVTLRSGRTVVATKGKSFLQRLANRLEQVDGATLRLGDLLPVSRILPIPDELTHLDRADYPLPAGGCCAEALPQRLPLDAEFGCFVGAYLATGRAREDGAVVLAAYADASGAVRAFCGRYGLACWAGRHHGALHVAGAALGALFCEHFGPTHGRTAPVELLAGPVAFLRGLLAGYFDGRCTVHPGRQRLTSTSRSAGLLEFLRQALLRFDVTSRLVGPHAVRGRRGARPAYTLLVDGGDARRFAERLPLSGAARRRRLAALLAGPAPPFAHAAPDLVPGTGLAPGPIGREALPALLAQTADPERAALLRRILAEDVLYDEIVALEEVPNPRPHVYDLTVAVTRNFNLYNGLLCADTFHGAGIKGKNVTLGVPRIKELVDCTKNPKTPEMRLVVLPSYSGEAALERLCLGLVDTPLSKAIAELRYYEEPDFFDSALGGLDAHLAARLRLVRPAAPATYGLFVARLVLRPPVLVPRGLSPSDIAGLIEQRCDCDVAASDELHDEWILRVRFSQLAAGTSPHPEGSVQERAYLQTATEELMHRLCRDIPLGGLPGIHSATPQKEELFCYSDAGPTKQSVLTISTAGTNLAGVLALPHFDAARCVTNDVHETLQTLGVEAATALLFEQIQFTLQFDGSYVNERHILLLVSFMTSMGGLLPVSRHGINKLEASGPLARASFEEVSERLAESAIFGDVDPALCHSAKIMIGERCSVGTGMCDIVEEASDAASVADSDEVVFTLVEGEGHGALSCGAGGDGVPVEMPFADDDHGLAGCGQGLPKAVQASYLHVAPSCARAYAPSSPKTLATERKRNYAPSSPRGLKRRCGES